jgi:transposase
MRPHGSPKTLEKRRRKALALLNEGLSLSAVAHKVGSSQSSVFRWKEAYEKAGEAGLAPKPVPGRPSKLSEEQWERLWKILLEGALAYGFPNDLWTLKRMTSVVRREFRVRIHPGHLWKVLHQEGWSCQVPERRAIQRDDAAIERWKRYKWPGIKKTPRSWRPPRLP